jgi:hypothetical protein
LPFENAAGGIVRKTAGTISTPINVPFENDGVLEIQVLTVELSAGSAGSGLFTGAPGTTLRFGGGAHTLEPGSIVSVPTLSVTTGTVDFHGACTVTLATGITGGTATFHPDATLNSLGASLSIAAGTLDLSSGEPVGVTTLAMPSGILQGTDTLTVSGATTWSGGAMGGAGTTSADGGIAISGSAVKDLTDARRLNTAGATTWIGIGQVRLSTAAVIHNTGTWEAQSDALVGSFTTGGLFENAASGTFRKTGATQSTTFQVAFTNAGSVRAQKGTLSFAGGYTQNAGSTTAEGGTIASVVGLDIQGGSIGGSGTINAAVADAGHLAPGLSPGPSMGAVTIVGTCTQTAGAAFDVDIAGLVAGSGHDQANITGAATLAGALDVTLVNGFVPAELDTFTVMTFPSSVGEFDAFNLPVLGGDLAWKYHHNANAIVLEIVADLDGDGVRNASDCAPTDPGTWSLPAEIAGVAFAADNTTMSWDSLSVQAGPAVGYDAMRGLISQLPAGGGAAETCLASGTAATSVADLSTPALGTGYYYLVRGGNPCGKGTYGTRSNGTPRTPVVCP